MNNTMPLRIKALIKKKKTTQKMVAAKIGVSEVTFCRYMKGLRKPPVDVLNALARELDTTVDYLLNGELKEVDFDTEYRELLLTLARMAPNLTNEQRDELVTILLSDEKKNTEKTEE